MAAVPVFVVANGVITDAEEYQRYEKQVVPMIRRYQGEVIAFDKSFVTLEGESPPQGQLVILKFPSEELAKAWYADKDYQKIAEHRRAGSSTKFSTLVRGLPPR